MPKPPKKVSKTGKTRKTIWPRAGTNKIMKTSKTYYKNTKKQEHT